jgi:hypothetical protein
LVGFALLRDLNPPRAIRGERFSTCFAKDRPKSLAKDSGRAEAQTLPAIELHQLSALTAMPAF